MTSKDIAIYIPSYKNRYDELFNYLNKIDNYDIYLILSEDDDQKKNYFEKYNFNMNIHFIETSCKTIGEKRQYIIDNAYHCGYKYAVQLDDDIRGYASKITKESKRTTSDSYAKIRIELKELIDNIVDYIRESKVSYVSPMFPFSLGFSKPGSIHENKSLNFGQCNVIDVDKVHKLGLKYDTRPNVHEDIDMVIQLLQHGCTCITLGDYAFEVVPNSSNLSSSVVAGNSALDLCRMSLYCKYRDGITLRIGKRGELRMTCNLSKYWNTEDIPIKDDEYHKKVYELCLAQDADGLKELIRSKK